MFEYTSSKCQKKVHLCAWRLYVVNMEETDREKPRCSDSADTFLIRWLTSIQSGTHKKGPPQTEHSSHLQRQKTNLTLHVNACCSFKTIQKDRPEE